MSLAFRGAGSKLEKLYSSGAYIPIVELKTVELGGAKADLADVTNLDSVGNFREWLPTLLDAGDVTCNGNYLGAAGQTQQDLLDDFNAETLNSFKIVLAQSKGVLSFQGYISEPPYPKVSFDKPVEFTTKIKVTGPITFTLS